MECGKTSPVAVVAGVGPGLGAALCERLVEEGYRVAGLARTTAFGETLAHRLNINSEVFRIFCCDVTDEASVANSVAEIRACFSDIAVLIYNAGYLSISSFLDLSSGDFEAAWRNNCLGAVHCARSVVADMKEAGRGVMIFTGATASIRGARNFAAFASAKFALRGMVQSLAREYGPEGLHVAHVIVDGIIWGRQASKRFGADESSCLPPDAVAEAYIQLIRQPCSAWTQELDLRTYREEF